MPSLDLTALDRCVAHLLRPYEAGPGATVGVVLGGELAVHRSAGLASLELGVPIGPATTFRIASVSKQFTCAAILLLAEDGKLKLDDDIRAWLPELPDYGSTITIDHLMHNTSGLRDMLEIMRLGGADLSTPVRPEDLMDGICRQRTLNFAPGSRYLYSNTNFLLLGRIAERAAGEGLRAFLARRIFTPAGMNNTGMVETTTEPVAHLATGYLPAPGGGFVRAQHGFPLHGEGGLVSCVTDLALWHRNFTTMRVCGKAVLDGLTVRAPFTGGMMNGYARGLQASRARGFDTVSHGGLWPGYRTEFLRVPALDAAVIVIANNAAVDPYHLGQRVLDALVAGRADAAPAVALPGKPALEKHVGRFLDEAGPATVDLALNEAGQLTGTTNGVPFLLKAEPDGRLAASRTARDFTMKLSDDGAALAVEQDAGFTSTWTRVAPGAALPADLPGRYRSAEMDAVWTITSDGDGMRVTVAGPVAIAPPWPLEGVKGDIFRAYNPGTLYRSWQDVRVLRENGAVSGLFVNGGRVKNLRFTKLAEGA